MSGQIAEFWASLGFKIDPAELKKVDKFLGDAEKRLKGNSKKKTEESKATDKVAKSVKGEVAAKSASVKADVAATKAINQKTSATKKLTAAEREAQRVGARLRSTPFVNTAAQQRINSMFPAMAGGVLGARSQDRQLLTSFYRGAFDKVASKPTPVASTSKTPLANFNARSMVSGGRRENLQRRIDSLFPSMRKGVLPARGQDRRQLEMFYRGAFDKIASKSTPVASTKTPLSDFNVRDMASGGKRENLQRRIETLFPSMRKEVLPARSQDRRQLEMFYRGAFDRAEKGGVEVRNPAAAEGRALSRIGKNSPAFGTTGRVADLIRQRRVQPEASALGSLGMKNPRFKPLGSAFKAYDEKLDQAVARTRAQGAERRRLKHLALAEQRMSHLAPPKTRSPEMRSMSDFYKKQEKESLKAAREQAKLRKEGVKSEKEIERTRRRGVISERRARRTERLRAATPVAQTRPSVAMASYGRSPANHNSGNFLRAGGAGGAFARYGVGSLPFIGGAYGFSTLNRSNQEAITTRLTTQAVLQGQGYTEEQGVEAFDWLRDLGNDIGFSYMDAAPDYNQFLANSLGAGMDVEGTQDIFKGLSEYQTAMGTTPYRRKLINNALSQMMGKGVLSMEEVRRQMADSLPGTISLFSEAYAELIGSGETGLDAQSRFYNDIATGTIKSAEILPIFARLASKRAEPKIGIMKETSIAEQGRFKNELSDLLMVASDSGLEKGMADFFKTLASGVRSARPLIRGLAGSFRDLTIIMGPIGDLFTDFNRGLESISQVTGVAEKNIVSLIGLGAALSTKWGRVAAAFTAVAIVLQDISWGVQGRGKSVTGDFFKLMDDKGLGLGEFEKALFGVSSALLAIALGLKAIGAAAKMAGLGGLLPSGDKDDKNGKRKRGVSGKAVKGAGLLGLAYGAYEVVTGTMDSFSIHDPDNPNHQSGFYRDSNGNLRLGVTDKWLEEIKMPSLDPFGNSAAKRFERNNPHIQHHSQPPSNYTPIPGISAPMKVDSKVDLSVKVEVGSLEEMQRYLEVEFPEVINGVFEEVMPQFSEKE